MTKLTSFLNTSSLLLAGALVGLTLAACDLGPKKIGEESMGDGPVCEEGEKKDADDGCNTCTCSEGEWACTELACEEPVCQDGDTKMIDCNTCGCVDGQWGCTQIGCEPQECTPGETKELDCNTCECTEGGLWACTDIGCEPDKCKPGDEKWEDCNACDCTPEGIWACDTQECPAVCGDGVIGGGEQCDDGNAVDDDGCSNTCVLNGGDVCEGSGTLTIDNAAIVGDELVVDVGYGGGCQEHFIDLCWNGIVEESLPPQTGIDLSHTGVPDPCEAWIMEQRKISLLPIKEALVGEASVVLHLTGWADPILYTF